MNTLPKSRTFLLLHPVYPWPSQSLISVGLQNCVSCWLEKCRLVHVVENGTLSWFVAAALLSARDWWLTVQQMYGSNGAGTLTSCTVVKPLPPPGNWLHPAGLRLGYSAARVRLYCQAKWGAPAPIGELTVPFIATLKTGSDPLLWNRNVHSHAPKYQPFALS